MAEETHPVVVVIGGTAGTGKSTVGAELTSFFQDKYPGTAFIEGDAIHPQANIDKMSRGIPLTDEDRWGWLQDVARISAKSAEHHSGLAIVSCSSLKLKYRDLMREKEPDTRFAFLFLYADPDVILQRFAHREGHFMKANMAKSQFADLELPKNTEKDAHVLNVDGKDMKTVLHEAIEQAKTWGL
ncbi:LAMI_0H02366g1_1 [Lachancea mirantina]|uniref:Gluconokinase n=1 Tax=Lachancea mirantina TaxID=1230905 RepID=A0A1G4KE13_9SACH|nr:LAMI_0H02366g1_1 [Lachancea mirantina]